MKKLIASVSVAAVLGLGGTYLYTQSNDEDKVKTEVLKEDPVQEASIEQAEETKADVEVKEKKVVEPPTERTKNIEDQKPWDVYSAIDMIDHREEEQYFLFSDAEALENEIVSFYQSGEINQKYSAYVDVFAVQLEEYYPDENEYFVKMKEVSAAIREKNFEAVPNLIEQAKQLRES
ncbi:hypothetical protein ACFFIX_06685 [Metabacillus herbersteinensis]|uniref:Uncharacterized protein n=1 Tax=Metabacillus herbersteinensis TaxID=283816 RepID=A0ABV6GDW2_9BACI